MYVLGWKGVIKEFIRYKSGLIGLILLIILVGMAVFAPFLSSETVFYKWYDLSDPFWTEQNIPKGVPPSWINMFSEKKYSLHEKIQPEISEPNPLFYNITFTYDYEYDVPPYDIVIDVSANISEGSQILIFIDIIRPDGHILYRVVDLKTGKPVTKISLRSAAGAFEKIYTFGLQFESEETRREITEKGIYRVLDPLEIIFSIADEGILYGKSGPLKGEYKFIIGIYRIIEENTLNNIEITISGSAYGLLGTDALGRDLFGGVVWGSRIALIIGLGVAIISVAIAIIYGTISAYLGGWTDEILQRIQEFVISIPVLPLLLILAYVFTPTVWNLMFLLVIFSWPGPVKTIRSMALQIREQLYIASAKAIGLSTWRVIARYILPQILPYTFALIAFAVPGAILTEAGVSFLLGSQGALEVTWGRILNDAARFSAALTGMWWWVVPPGLMISIAGLAFVLVGNALDRVLNPRLIR